MASYLVHFNRLHDKKGRFTFGDGDGDGRRNDRRVAEGDRVRDVPNAGRSGFEGGGGGRFGSGRTSSGEYSKREAESSNTKPNHKPRYGGNEVDNASRRDNKLFGDPKAAETNQTRSLANNKQVGISRRSGRDYIVKAGRRNPPEKSGDQTRNGSSNPWDSVRGSNINVAGGSSKGYGSSLSAEQVDEYRVAGQSWVVDKLDEITDPEWWKEQEKKARVQLGLYVKGDKTVSGKSHEVTPKATKVTKSTPKKQEKQKTR